MAGIEDCYTSARGSTGTLGNFGMFQKFCSISIYGYLDFMNSLLTDCNLFLIAKATYAAIAKTYAYLTPDLWKDCPLTKAPYAEFADFLARNHRPVAGQRSQNDM